MHTIKFGELPDKFDSYMILKHADGRKNIVNINSNTVKTTNLEIPSNKPRLQSDNISDKPFSPSDTSFNTTQTRACPSRGPEKLILSTNLNERSKNCIDKLKKTNEKRSLTNVKITVPGKSGSGTATHRATKPNEDVLKKQMLDSDIIDSSNDLRRKTLIVKLSDVIVNKSVKVDATDSLERTKRKSPLVKPGPSSKKQKLVTDKCDTSPGSLRSVRKTGMNRT